jgi:hypothetical protein
MRGLGAKRRKRPVDGDGDREGEGEGELRMSIKVSNNMRISLAPGHKLPSQFDEVLRLGEEI